MTEDEGGRYEVENPPVGWHELDVSRLSAQREGPALFRLFGVRFTSGSDDAERFLHDPLAEMAKEPLLGVTSDFTVTTIVVRHELGLAKHPMIVLLLIALGTRAAVVTIYKAP